MMLLRLVSLNIVTPAVLKINWKISPGYCPASAGEYHAMRLNQKRASASESISWITEQKLSSVSFTATFMIKSCQ